MSKKIQGDSNKKAITNENAMDKCLNIILKVVQVICIAIFGILSVISILGTTYIDDTMNGYKEYAYFEFDNYLITILLVVLFFAVISIIDHFKGIDKINTKKIRMAATIYVIALGVAWILIARAHPVNDQSIIYNAASDFIQGNYEKLEQGQYLNYYPHQLGIVFIIEIIFRIFGTGNYQAVMIINVLCVAVIFNMLYLILTKITSNVKTYNWYWIMVFGCLPVIFYSFFVYGTIIGLMFALIGIYNLYLFYEKDKFRYYVIAFVAFSLAVISKNNFQIFVIAAICVLLFLVIKKRQYQYIILVLLLALSIMSPKLITTYYAQRSGIETGGEMPTSLYVAMGLQEGDEENACGAAGWYNKYNVTTYSSTNWNAEEASEIGWENIRERLSEFAENPSIALQFAFEKISTQWDEPTFQTFWMVDAIDNHDKWSGLAEDLISGDANTVITYFMKIYLMMVWVGNFAYMIFNFKKMNIWKMFLSVVVIGGFFFHFVWEGKALYIMPYFAVSLVSGSMGILYLYEKIKDKISSPKNKKIERKSEAKFRNVVE